MNGNFIVNPTMYRLYTLVDICLSSVEFSYPYLLNLNGYLLPNVASHTMDFLPNAEELVCEQLSSEIYTKILHTTVYLQPLYLNNINKNDLALGLLGYLCLFKNHWEDVLRQFRPFRYFPIF